VNYGIQTKAERIAMRANLYSKTNKSLSTKVKSVAEKRRNLRLGGKVEGGLRLPMGQRWESRGRA
jgi:hypothetical protein